MRRVKDSRTIDLFLIPQPEHPAPGSADYAFQIAHLTGQVLKECPHDRYEISTQMSRLTGRDISKNAIDAWASPARNDYNLPLFLTPVLEEVCSTHAFTDWLVAKRGGRVAYGKDALNAELGKLERVKEDAARKIRELKKLMGDIDD